MAALRHTIRGKLVLFTVLPVLAVYLILFWLGVSYVRDYVGADARQWLHEHARHQASRLALVLSQVPKLAEGLGDLVLAEPDQSKALWYAHLIDGLRRTPIAMAVGVQYGTPLQGAQMRRGEPVDLRRQVGDAPRPWHGPGWHQSTDTLLFERPIFMQGRDIGGAWVELTIADIYAEIGRQRDHRAVLLLTRDDGTVLRPAAGADPQTDGVAALLPRVAPTDQIIDVGNDASRAGIWLASSSLAGLPWRITAAMPADRALAAARETTAQLAAALLVSLIAIVLTIGVAARQITRPLAALDAGVHGISRGNFTLPPGAMSNDEVGALARTIERMAGHIADRENQLRAAQQVLEQRVSERTAALQQSNSQLIRQIEETRQTQEALRLANEQAQQASRAKSEFLSNMSHELRTPLHGVLGYAQILRRDTATDSSQRESVEAIERCGQHLLTLINDILDMAKIEAGQMQADLQATDLMQLLEDVRMIVAQRAANKGLELRLVLAPDLPAHIITDGVKLKQILLNLLGNAVKFTHRGSVTLVADAGGDHCLDFEVIDTGVGIAGDRIGTIFEAFNQVRDGQAVDGTGLGLAINQRLIRLLGGEPLQVESAPDEGSRFRFRLPYRPVTGDPSSRPIPAGSLPAGGMRLAAGAHCTVMVVDESPESRNVVSTLLRYARCEVESFPSRGDALRRLRERPFDLALVDVRLPAAEAAELVHGLRRSAVFGSPKLVAVSASVFLGAELVARQAGFDALLTKPFSEHQLFALIGALLDVRFERGQDQPSAAGESQAAWPPDLARETARRIEAAVDLGDIGNLFQLTEELAADPAAPRTDVENMALMARLFDFEGLRHLSQRLQQDPGAAGSMA